MFEEVSFMQLQNRHIIKKALVFAVEGTQTPAGNSGRVETPQRAAQGGLGFVPRKAKCLERKTPAPFKSKTNFKTILIIF
ncbi:hypothetical protein B14911_07608 [Bacillus sp. NRRL B-14911]|uniref:Uncharacterized protein n=1 Tax=Bacillus infantis NRRL B-14911 TaxID=1367477 RepID=U5LBZ0_9BACI|nr:MULTISPECIES: hypothetical protein [Bacillus]AGX04117.1 hypothetical protein N288_11025 [Bacillus infantis NRRL B-14911]EAR63389.1 hypothetical protein B14911_07608 [Bacillus sp. NRRL B-14911]